MNNLKTTLREFLQENFLFGQEVTFADDASFLEQGIIDSTGVLELVTFLEDHFQITLADDELVPENLDSIDNLARFLKAKHASPASVQR